MRPGAAQGAKASEVTSTDSTTCASRQASSSTSKIRESTTTSSLPSRSRITPWLTFCLSFHRSKQRPILRRGKESPWTRPSSECQNAGCSLRS
eukprot:8043651-Pyramimonas_sp.AAC.1